MIQDPRSKIQKRKSNRKINKENQKLFLNQFKASKMKKTELKSSWTQVKATLKSKFSGLTDKDLTYVEGKEDEFYKRLQEKLGKSRAEVDQIIEKVHSTLKEKASRSKD